MKYFSRNAGNKIFYREWLVPKPKGVVVVAHGLCEHSGRYEKVAKKLNEAEYSVVALDHQGHGRTYGLKGHIDSFESVGKDLDYFILKTREENPGKKIHLLGHSMGGVIATAHSIRHSGIESLIISAPGYEVNSFKSKCELTLARYLKLFAPRVSLATGFDANQVCRDINIVNAYIADPLVSDKVTIGLGSAFYEEQRFIKKNINTIATPCLMLLAGKDSLVDTQKATEMFLEMSNPENQKEYYPESYHEILNEKVEGEWAITTIIDWLNEFD